MFNAPFVISPTFQAHYRDNEFSVDTFCQKVIREAPQFLNDGGYLQIMCNWAHVAGRPRQERLAEWFDGTECDAWVLRNETRNPSNYAVFWLGGESGCADFVRTYDQWMTYYEK